MGQGGAIYRQGATNAKLQYFVAVLLRTFVTFVLLVPWWLLPIYSMVTLVIVTGESGRSLGPVGTAAMALTTSCPALTLPKMV